MVYRADEERDLAVDVYFCNRRGAMWDGEESRRCGGADHGNRQGAGRRRLEAPRAAAWERGVQ